VNVSPQQLMARGFTANVTDVLSATGMDPTCLVLEVTESIFVDDSERAMTILRELKGLGLRLALDDFGTRQPNRPPGIHPEGRFTTPLERDYKVSVRSFQAAASSLDRAHRGSFARLDRRRIRPRVPRHWRHRGRSRRPFATVR